MQELTQLADGALYLAKQSGRDQARIAGGSTRNGAVSADLSDPLLDSGQASRARPFRPATPFHQATVDDDPAPAGLEIR